jgi:hypothetical protein
MKCVNYRFGLTTGHLEDRTVWSIVAQPGVGSGRRAGCRGAGFSADQALTAPSPRAWSVAADGVSPPPPVASASVACRAGGRAKRVLVRMLAAPSSKNPGTHG